MDNAVDDFKEVMSLLSSGELKRQKFWFINHLDGSDAPVYELLFSINIYKETPYETTKGEYRYCFIDKPKIDPLKRLSFLIKTDEELIRAAVIKIVSDMNE
jgi:hypothetical protein